MNELRFTYGALVTNVKEKTKDWMLGDHRGDKQKYFKRSHIRFLTKDELAFVNDLVSEKIACLLGFRILRPLLFLKKIPHLPLHQ